MSLAHLPYFCALYSFLDLTKLMRSMGAGDIPVPPHWSSPKSPSGSQLCGSLGAGGALDSLPAQPHLTISALSATILPTLPQLPGLHPVLVTLMGSYIERPQSIVVEWMKELGF